MKGSHKCGRIEHSMVAGQTAADIDRVRELKKKLELVYVELEPGILNYIVHIQLLTLLKFSKSYQQFKISIDLDLIIFLFANATYRLKLMTFISLLTLTCTLYM